MLRLNEAGDLGSHCLRLPASAEPEPEEGDSGGRRAPSSTTELRFRLAKDQRGLGARLAGLAPIRGR